MSSRDPDRQHDLDRPVRSLLDLRIGTLLKAYVLWIVGGGLVAILVGLVIFGAFDSGSTGSGSPERRDVTYSSNGGESVTLAQYRAVQTDARRAVVERRFGPPATTENPTAGVTPEELQEDCLGYRRADREGGLFFFCFSEGRLSSKHAF